MMKRLSYLGCLVAIALSTTTMTACGETTEETIIENSSANVSEGLSRIFTTGMPKVVNGYTIARNEQGQVYLMKKSRGRDKVVFEYKAANLANTNAPDVVMTVTDDDDKKVYNLFLNNNGYIRHCDEIEYERGESPKRQTWDFEYNAAGQLSKVVSSEDGYETTTITYKDGNIVRTSVVSGMSGIEKDRHDIFYTSNTVATPILNKGNVMFFDDTFDIDIEELQYAYYAGLLGKATKHLPVRSIDEKNEVSTFRWTLDSNGYPTCFSEGDDTKRITW
ncbi:DUF4595 domain-containing protein [Prevotella aurantiaca]|uniref:DUF4595 domain-containing protein n=1 Tax=Prevotella aurantiaca TaxID=596085 RepID=UPI001CAD4238|nr:DUF4595 domain-containing protein [Prevotella aurantiaca]MBF1386455.1 DUF4595 domain-containing protein [Prevotella aurantiaca]